MPADVAVIEPVAERRAELEEEFAGVRTLSAPEPGLLADGGERLPGAVLATKPDAAEGACRALGVTGVTRVLSIVAGVPAQRLESALGGQPSVVRAMPNTPALVGAGVTAISGGSFATSADLAWAEDVLSAVGTVVRLPERLLDAVTGLSGSGPAYLFLVAEAMIEAGVQMGLTREVSHTLVVETMAGSAALLKETGRDPAALRAEVTSPAGHDGGRHPRPRGAGHPLGLHGGGGRRHRTVPQPGPLRPRRADRARPHRLLPLGLRDAGRVRRGGARGDRRPGPRDHRHRPDP